MKKIRSQLKNALPLFLLIFLCWNPLLFSQERFRKSPPNPEPFVELRLPEINYKTFPNNGLTLAIIQRENLPIISLKAIIFSGEDSSPENLPGIATLTANMISRGVSHLTSSRIEEEIESIGGRFFTSIHPDHSVFTFTFLEEYLDRALSLLSRMFLQPTFLSHEIENVKRSMQYGIIQNKTDPEFLAKRQLFRLLFRDHPYYKSTLNEDLIRYLNQKDLISYFRNYYRPNNALIVLTGNLNITATERLVSRYFYSWRKKELLNSPLLPPKPFTEQKVCLIDLPGAKDATIYLGNVVYPVISQDIFPLIALNQVLGGTPKSRLFMNLRESKGYAYYAFSNVGSFKSCSVFFVNARVTPEVTYSSINEILKEIEGITKNKIPIPEIEQAKSYLIGNLSLQIETFENLSSKASEFNILNMEDELWKKYYENIMLIDSKRVLETAGKYPLLTPVIVIVGDSSIILDNIREFGEVELFNKKGVSQGILHLNKGEKK